MAIKKSLGYMHCKQLSEEEETPTTYDFAYWILIGLAFTAGMYGLRILQDYLWANKIIF